MPKLQGMADDFLAARNEDKRMLSGRQYIVLDDLSPHVNLEVLGLSKDGLYKEFRQYVTKRMESESSIAAAKPQGQPVRPQQAVKQRSSNQEPQKQKKQEHIQERESSLDSGANSGGAIESGGSTFALGLDAEYRPGLTALETLLKEDGLDSVADYIEETVTPRIRKAILADMDARKKEISEDLEISLFSRQLPDRVMLQRQVQVDPVVQRASALLKDSTAYAALLAPPEAVRTDPAATATATADATATATATAAAAADADATAAAAPVASDEPAPNSTPSGSNSQIQPPTTGVENVFQLNRGS
jgi:hypothetical protein